MGFGLPTSFSDFGTLKALLSFCKEAIWAGQQTRLCQIVVALLNIIEEKVLSVLFSWTLSLIPSFTWSFVFEAVMIRAHFSWRTTLLAWRVRTKWLFTMFYGGLLKQPESRALVLLPFSLPLCPWRWFVRAQEIRTAWPMRKFKPNVFSPGSFVVQPFRICTGLPTSSPWSSASLSTAYVLFCTSVGLGICSILRAAVLSAPEGTRARFSVDRVRFSVLWLKT